MKLAVLVLVLVVLLACVSLNDDPLPGRGCVNPEGYNNQRIQHGSKNYRCVSGVWRDDPR